MLPLICLNALVFYSYLPANIRMMLLTHYCCHCASAAVGYSDFCISGDSIGMMPVPFCHRSMCAILRGVSTVLFIASL
jgi:hypothetical protein